MPSIIALSGRLSGLAFAAAILAAPTAHAGDVIAGPPSALSVTIYRNPHRGSGSIELDSLGGFALIKETRLVRLPPGEWRLRFEGVVDGIQSVSAVVAGLPNGVIEKNRDAAVLSPSALVQATLGKAVTLVRTNRKTGQVTRVAATIRSANEDGLVFQTAAGVEAMKCSGLPETFSFARVPAGLSSTPTLSVIARSRRDVTATVTLAYLASDFDWAANYVATLAPDDRTLHLSAWITLANDNAVSLPAAHTQIVAGRLNRVNEDTDDASGAPDVIANCWPTGTTSDPHRFAVAANKSVDALAPRPPAVQMTSVQELVVTAERENLGDLKLYRMAETTTIAAQQSKQVRLLDQSDVPFSRLCIADLDATGTMHPSPATRVLRTRNDLANHLGLPLPAGEVAVFAGDPQLLIGETGLRDTTVDEDVELKLGPAADIQVRQTQLTYIANAPEITDLTPELRAIYLSGRAIEEVEISNASDAPAPFELRLQTYGSINVTGADQPMGLKDGRPIFRLTVPAGGAVKVRYTAG